MANVNVTANLDNVIQAADYTEAYFLQTANAADGFFEATEDNGAAQNFADTVLQTVLFRTSITANAAYNTTTAIFTAPSTGTYQFIYAAAMQSCSDFRLSLAVNGTTESDPTIRADGDNASSLGTVRVQGICNLALTAGDTVRVMGRQYSGTSRDLWPYKPYTYFSGRRIR